MMAVAAEGFSIREYAWRMRSVDMGKCWPFDATDEDQMKAMLPPIRVKKFTWWFDKLQIRLSDDDNLKQKLARDEGLSPNEGNDTEESDNTIAQLRQVIKKGKAPKKRSIVELFAVAPQVEVVDDEADDGSYSSNISDSDNDREDGCSNPKFSGSKNISLDGKGKKKEKKANAILRNQKKVIKKYKKMDNKKKKNREHGLMDFKIAKKERSNKIRVHSPVDFAANLKSSLYNKGLRKDNLDTVCSLTKKQKLKQSITEKKRKDLRFAKSLSKCQNREVAVRGILRNPTKVLPIQSSTSRPLQDDSQANPCSTHLANKHVTFSVKNDVLGPIWKVPPTVRPDAVTFVKDSSQETRESSDVVNTNGKRITFSIGNHVDVQPVTGGKMCVTCCDIARHNSQKQPIGNEDNLFERCITTNPNLLQGKDLHLLDRSFRVASQDNMHSCNPGCADTADGYGLHPIVQVLGTSSSASSIWGESGDLTGNHGPRLAEMCYKDFMKTHPQPSSFYLSNHKPNAMQGPITRNYSDMKHHPFLHFSPKELLHTLCSISDRKQEDTICGNSSVDECFVGLPLNSQGELIKLNSSGKRRFDQLTRPSITAGPSMNLAVPTNISLCRSNYSEFSRWDGRTPAEEHLQSFPSRDLVEKPYFVLPYGFGGDYQCTQRENVGLTPMNEYDHSTYPVKSDQDPMFLPQHDHRLYDQALRHTENVQIHQHGNPDRFSLHVTQSTMRLMGKEFTVGRKELQSFEDGDVWADKQITGQHLPGYRAMDKSQAQSEYILHSTSGKLREALACSSRMNVSEDLESVFQMKIPDSSCSLPHLVCQTDIVDQDVSRSIRESPAAVRSSYNYNFVLQEPVRLGHRISNISSQGPSFSRDELSKNVSSNYNNLPHASKFSFPFLYSLSEGHSRSSRWESTSRSIYPSTSDATQKGKFVGHFPLFPDLGSNHYADVQTSETFRSYDSFQPNFALQNPVGLGVLSHRPPVPQIPKSTLNLSMQSTLGDRSGLKDQTQSKICLRGPAPSRKANKRRATLSKNSMKPSKIPNLAFQGHYSCTGSGALKDQANNEGDVQCEVKAIELGPAIEPVGAEQGDIFELNQNRFKVSLGLDSSKLNNSTGAGPIKLTAGAKHILKPCQKTGQNNSMPIQSTIRFMETARGDKVPRSETLAKVYKF